MKDEIKEILNELQRVADRKCYPEDILCGSIAQEWVDCITNLQEENKKLKEELQQEKKDFKETNDYCFELKNYKSRCAKAIEYINSFYETPEYIDAYDITYWVDEVKKILTGDNNER